MPHNIERSRFRKGRYVGYGAGKVWSIRRWGARWQAHSGNEWRGADTLRELSTRIEATEYAHN